MGTTDTRSINDKALPKTAAALKTELDALNTAEVELTDEIEAKVQTRNEIRWRKAADVYAMIEPNAGNGRPAKKPEGRSETPPGFKRLSLTAFSKLGISGFRDRKVIAAYRATWERAMAAGVATSVNPGDMIDLPDVAFEDYWQSPKAEKAAQEAEAEKVAQEANETAEKGTPASPMTVVDRAVEALELVTKGVADLTDEEREILRDKVQTLLEALVLADAEAEMSE